MIPSFATGPNQEDQQQHLFYTLKHTNYLFQKAVERKFN